MTWKNLTYEELPWKQDKSSRATNLTSSSSHVTAYSGRAGSWFSLKSALLHKNAKVIWYLFQNSKKNAAGYGRYIRIILLTKITATENEAALSYYRVRGLYFQAVLFTAIISYTETLTFAYHLV